MSLCRVVGTAMLVLAHCSYTLITPALSFFMAVFKKYENRVEKKEK